MTTALYNRDILRLAATIPRWGRLDAPHASVEKRSRLCGSRVVVDVRLGNDGRVKDLAQEVKACALGQASAALMAAAAIDRTPEDLAAARDALADFLGGKRADPGAWPGIDILRQAQPYPARHASILLPFEAVAEAAARAWADVAGTAR